MRGWAGTLLKVRGWPLVLALPFLLLAPYVLAGHPLGADEAFHASATRQFWHALTHPAAFPATLQDYDAASGPLTYVILGICWGLTGQSIAALRLLALAVSYLDVLVLYRIAREQKSPYPAALAALLVVSPYFFLTSFMVMAQNFALLFGLLALRFALRGAAGGGRNLAAAMGLATLAALCRQIWLFLPCAVAAAWAVEQARAFLRRNEPGQSFDCRKAVRDAALTALPFVVMGLLFLYWGGFANKALSTRLATPEACAIYGQHLASQTRINPQPEFVSFFLVITGAYFGALFLLQPSGWRRGLAFAAALAPLFLLWPPRFHFGGGLVMQSVHIAASKALPSAELVVHFALWLLGALALGSALFAPREAPEGAGGVGPDARARLLLGLALGFFLAMNVLASRLWERYLMEAVPLTALVIWPRVAANENRLRRILAFAWIAILACVTAAFACYKCEVQGGGRFF